MAENETKTLLVENAKILFRNFGGREGLYNSEGDRNFSLILEPDLAKKLMDEGWRVKQLKSREEGEEGDYHLKVNVNYKKGRPPRCVLISSEGRNDLGADEVEILDIIELKNVDVLVNGWWSDMAGGGYGGYLKSIFVTMAEDDLEKKYAMSGAGQTPTEEDDNFNE